MGAWTHHNPHPPLLHHNTRRRSAPTGSFSERLPQQHWLNTIYSRLNGQPDMFFIYKQKRKIIELDFTWVHSPAWGCRTSCRRCSARVPGRRLGLVPPTGSPWCGRSARWTTGTACARCSARGRTRSSTHSSSPARTRPTIKVAVLVFLEKTLLHYCKCAHQTAHLRNHEN